MNTEPTQQIVILKTMMKTKLPSLLVNYLRDVEYEDGTGEGLAQEILNDAQKRNAPPTMIEFGSDGVNVMSGEGKGVNGGLKEQNGHMALLVKIFYGLFIYPNGPNFLKMAHNFPLPWAIGSFACFAFPILFMTTFCYL